MKLYLDADISLRVARTLTTRGYDVIAAQEAGKADASDAEQMAFAAKEGRALLTCNARDFTPIFEDYWFAGRNHSGVIVSEQLELGELIRRVVALLDTVAADEIHNNWKNLAEFTR